MTIELTRKTVVSALAGALIAIGGMAVCLVALQHFRSASDSRTLIVYRAGDAPPAVQAEVRVALREFQDGYIQRDPRNLDAFMGRLFDKNDDILILGTDRAEWVRGYANAGAFIQRYWQGWGDFRFSVDDAVICASGDVAWVVSFGTVRTKGTSYPIRLSAILTRHGHRWLFRQLQFQWERKPLSPASLFTIRP